MVVAHLNGQLGNQMFVYATSYAISRELDERLVVYKYEYDTIYRKQGYQLGALTVNCVNKYKGVPLSLYWHTTKKLLGKICNVILRKSLIKVNKPYQNNKIDFIVEQPNTYTEIRVDHNKKVHVIEGFWQSYLYFDKYYNEIVKQFSPAYELSYETKRLISEIEIENYAVAVHIRRGDYEKIGCCLTMEYYYCAMKKIQSMHPDSKFYVFSDNIEWVMKNLNVLDFNVKFVKRNAAAPPFDDIWVMSKCCANIIANSSFSWWAAYLNINKDKYIVAPKKIYDNNNKIIPNNWHVIDDETGLMQSNEDEEREN